MLAQTSVVPVDSSTSAPSALSRLYTIEVSRDLATIRAKQTIKAMWLSPRGLRVYNRLLHRLGGFVLVVNAVSSCLCIVIAFYSAPVGRWIAVVSTPPMLVTTVAILLGMRYDMILLVLGTFDFWYQFVTSFTSALLFGIYMRDARIAAAAGIVPMQFVILLADANLRAARIVFAFACIAAAMCFADVWLLAVSTIAESHPIKLVSIGDQTSITGTSVMIHGLVVITIIHVRNAYVRRHFVRASKDEALKGQPMTTVRCALYRSRLRWQGQLSGLRQAVQLRPVRSSFNKDTIQLRCSRPHHVIDANRTLLLSTGRHCHAFGAWKLWFVEGELLVSAAVGYATMTATFATVSAGLPHMDSVVFILGLTSLLTTSRVWIFFFCYVDQLDVLWLLHTSFHFLFIFVQLVLSHVCLASMSDWDGRALASIASLLWIHWALTIDAIPSDMRRLLGVDARRLAAAIESSFLVALALGAYDLLALNSQQFRDDWVVKLGAHSVDWSVASFFLNRFPTLFAWLSRSLWRLTTYDANEFFVLDGAVEYDDYETTKRQTKSAPSKIKIRQFTSALSEQRKQKPQGETTN